LLRRRRAPRVPRPLDRLCGLSTEVGIGQVICGAIACIHSLMWSAHLRHVVVPRCGTFAPRCCKHHRGISCDVEEPRVALGSMQQVRFPALWTARHFDAFCCTLHSCICWQARSKHHRGISCDVEEPRVALGSHAASALCGTLDSSVAPFEMGSLATALWIWNEAIGDHCTLER
jgi:hypothetical protein